MATEGLHDDDREPIQYAGRIIDASTDGDEVIHTVGAAVRDADGRIHGGVNLYPFTGGPCAELVALASARASGAREPRTIVAVGNGGRGPMMPCGRDRQVLRVYYPNTRAIIPTADDAIVVGLSELLPWDPNERLTVSE